MADLELTTAAFRDGERIPDRYTCEGEDVSPQLAIGGVPAEAESFAVVVDDPDAPDGTFTHWLLWNLPADVTEIPAGVERTGTVAELDGAKQGTNDFGELGYRGPCPPVGDPPHTYRVACYALADRPTLDSGANRNALFDDIEESVVAEARLTGEYARR